jgi:endogenous inhibitor of DNA gyrase (YacG/DUF329 family)
MTAAELPCPICHRPVPTDARTAPFCSPRCRQVDLVRWSEGKYAVRRELAEEDLTNSSEEGLATGSDADHDDG